MCRSNTGWHRIYEKTTKAEVIKQQMGASSFEHGGMEIGGEDNGMKIGVLADT